MTGKSHTSCEFLFGSKEEISNEQVIKTDIDALTSIGFDQVQGEEVTKRIASFALSVFKVSLSPDISREGAQEWLYDNLPKYEAFVKLNKICRDGAKSYNEIKEAVFGDTYSGNALDALLVLVSLAAKDGNVLFPVRLHMFLRG